MESRFNWQFKTFQQLTTTELYDILKLRVDVFVVEQTCYYPDLDDLDRDLGVIHQYAYDGENIVGYCRILPPGLVYNNESAIGRVVIAPSYRGQKLAVELMTLALKTTETSWPDIDCHISAQQHLSEFYQGLGFIVTTNMYLEDDIPHVGMVKKASF